MTTATIPARPQAIAFPVVVPSCSELLERSPMARGLAEEGIAELGKLTDQALASHLFWEGHDKWND